MFTEVKHIGGYCSTGEDRGICGMEVAVIDTLVISALGILFVLLAAICDFFSETRFIEDLMAFTTMFLFLGIVLSRLSMVLVRVKFW